MWQLFLQYSGILAVLVAWVLVVAPAIIGGIDLAKETITGATRLSKKASRVISAGLVIGALLQATFLLHLIQKFHLPYLSIGNLLYLSSNLATILVALFHYDRYPNIHNILVAFYFIFCPLSLGFIAYTLKNINPDFFTFSLWVVFFYFLVEGYLLIKFKGSVYLEIWAFLILSIWTTVITY